MNKKVCSWYCLCMETARLVERVQTLHVGAFNHACVQVSPVESMVHIINGQSVGPAHFIHQGRNGAAIHVCSGYTRSTTPLCPVHVAAETKHFSSQTHKHRLPVPVCNKVNKVCFFALIKYLLNWIIFLFPLRNIPFISAMKEYTFVFIVFINVRAWYVIIK